MKRLLSPTLLLLPAVFLTACAGGAPKTEPALTPETVKVEPAKPKITSSQLLGQPGPWVRAQLGEPQFVRTERTANIWQYKHGPCVLNVFLYKEGETDPRVLHFDARNTAGGNADRDACLASVQD